MSFTDLATRPLAEYLDAHRDAGAFWFFMHIPKTAGSSVSNELSARMSPYANVHVDHTDPQIPHRTRLEAAVDGFLDRHREKPFRSASGHVPHDLLDRIREAIPHTRAVTFLRDPVKRVISDYRYQRTPMHPLHEEFSDRFPTLEAYVGSAESQNKMSRFLGWTQADGTDWLTEILNRFAFVGLVEMYPLSFSCMFGLMGMAGQRPTVHARRTPDTQQTRVETDEELLRQIARTNRDDILLYNTVRAILVPKREEWRSSLGHGPAAPVSGTAAG